MGKKAMDMYEKIIKKYEKQPSTATEILAVYCRIKDQVISELKEEKEKANGISK
jgi:hypothetical protein